jgi:prephenate dehydrogenase
MNIVFIGIGLMGGSMALAMRELNYATNYIGVSRNPETIKKAIQLNLINQSGEIESVIPTVDFVVLATPIDAIKKQLPLILDLIKEDAVVIDLGSTKESIAQCAENHPKRKNFVATHPICGTEYSGPESAFASLYQNKVCIICDKEKSHPIALKKVEDLYTKMQMKLIYMNAVEHDLHLAFVSHLSHIISFALSNTVLDEQKNSKAIFDLAGSGFESTVRLAKSSPEMWVPILLDNKKAIIQAIENYTNHLNEIKSSIKKNNAEEIFNYLLRGNAIGKILK